MRIGPDPMIRTFIGSASSQIEPACADTDAAAAHMHARDPLARTGDTDGKQRRPLHLIALLRDDARAVRDAVPYEVCPQRSAGRPGRGVLRQALPWRVHPPVDGVRRVNRLGAEDV